MADKSRIKQIYDDMIESIGKSHPDAIGQFNAECKQFEKTAGFELQIDGRLLAFMFFVAGLKNGAINIYKLMGHASSGFWTKMSTDGAAFVKETEFEDKEQFDGYCPHCGEEAEFEGGYCQCNCPGNTGGKYEAEDDEDEKPSTKKPCPHCGEQANYMGGACLCNCPGNINEMWS